ncbi:MAG: glycosyl hydrolase-related protein [Microthrixaceae bacterium]|nr:glycosyl hydrolase-related protein [Microthrixaceae bacterium]
MHDSSRITENRVNRLLMERLAPAETLHRQPLEVSALHLEGEPCRVDELPREGFERVSPGDRWGPPWGTTWFDVRGDSAPPDDPHGPHGLEVSVEIGFGGAMAGFQAEAALYVDRRIVCGIHPRRRRLPLSLVVPSTPAGGGDDTRQPIRFLVEAAANPDLTTSFTASGLGDPATAGGSPLYTFGGVDLVTYDREVRRLVTELATLNELVHVLERGSRRRQRLTEILRRCVERIDLDDVPGCAADARRVLAEGFEPAAAPGSMKLSAMGHAHIDTAWLWPMRETRRKCARTFSNQVRLLEEYPEHLFVCSQAAQYEFVREDHPELFEQISHHVARGRWVPVGAMWVEADMNLPSGESLVRQLVAGQRYFEEHFGMRCEEVWLPDVFGYPGSLPQIFLQAGCNRFLTQKLSWNKQNRFPHHSFTWEGIDGSRVIAHFPPIETYNSELTPRELSFASSNFADHAWSDIAVVPFGHGDGGGGPTAEMLDRARLLGDVAGLPRLELHGPSEFFGDLAAELERPGTPEWTGELYFEMHRGTLTSQAATKVGNRRCEQLLREVELWAATLGDARYSEELDLLWKRVLTQQFHDVLPGSSIAWVHHDAEAEHAAVLERGSQIRSELLERLPGGSVVANAATHARRELVVGHAAAPGGGPCQQLDEALHATLVEVPGLGTAPLVGLEPVAEVHADQRAISNGIVEARFDPGGALGSFRDCRNDREVVPAGSRCAALQIGADHPVEYDAWDIEQWTAPGSVDLPDAAEAEVTHRGPLLGAVSFTRRVGRSEVVQTYSLAADSARLDIRLDIDWHEDEKYLSIDFPLEVRAEAAACEIQFGKVDRPTHGNTSWDAAKFEVCAHRWVDMSEPSFGVAVLNDGRYGHSVQGGGIRVSLLRSPSYPDPGADRGRHRVTISLFPHGPGLAEVVNQAEALNLPLSTRVAPEPPGAGGAVPTPAAPVIEVSDRRVSVSAVKLADDGSGDLVVRLWEAVGDHVSPTVTAATALAAAHRCNLLEEPSERQELLDTNAVALELRPFELVTLRLRPAGSPRARC